MSQLPLPIAPVDALYQVIRPAMRLLPPALTSDSAQVLVLAIMLQESDGLRTRVQYGNGPARGLAQFERGGVRGVLEHPATAALAKALCAARGVPATSYSVYMALAGDDVLAAGMARLNLYADPHPLPSVTDTDGAFATYVRVWRPGAYTRGNDEAQAEIARRFAANHSAARKTLAHAG